MDDHDRRDRGLIGFGRAAQAARLVLVTDWIALLLSGLALVGGAIGFLLLDRSGKERAAAAAIAAKVTADDAKAKAESAHSELGRMAVEMGKAEATAEAFKRDVDRLSREKADASVVSGLVSAIDDVKAEMIRQFDKLEARFPPPKRNSR